MFILYVRFVMIQQYAAQKMARMRFEQEAFDPQGGGTGISGPTFSREHTLFRAIVEPVFLEAHEENLLFELAK